MAAANIKDLKIEPLNSSKCSICKQTLKSPRLLPCQHSFCLSCLKTHILGQEATNFLCPVCDFDVPLPPGGVECLPKNYLPKLMEENINEIRNCVYCEIQGKTRKAELQCLDCEDAVCNKCQNFHKTPGLSDHRLVSVKKLESGEYKQIKREEKFLICKKHGEGTRQFPLEFYCTDCQTLDCKKCILHEEKFYGKDTWQALYEKKMASLDKEVKRLLMNLKMQKDIVGVIHKVEENIRLKKVAIENQICDKATEIQELVENVKNKKLALVKEHFEKELQKCKMMLEKEGNQLKRFESTGMFVQDFMKNSTKGEYLMYEKDVRARMADFLVEREKFEIRTQDLIFKGCPAENLEQEISDVIGQFKKEKTSTDMFGKLKIIPVIKEKINLNLDAHEIAVAENGDIVAIGGSKVEILSKHGESRKVIECKELKHAWGVTLKNDKIIVSDSGNNSKQILVFNMNGHLRTAIRMPKSGQQQGSNWGIGVVVNSRGTIYICDEITSSIHTCTLDNTELKLFASKQYNTELYHPHNLSITPQGHLVVSNFSSKYIQVYSDKARLLWQIKNEDKPFGVCCDLEGHIFIGSYRNNRIHVVKDGVLKGMMEIPDIDCIRGLALSKDGDILVGHKTNKITKMSLWS